MLCSISTFSANSRNERRNMPQTTAVGCAFPGAQVRGCEPIRSVGSILLSFCNLPTPLRTGILRLDLDSEEAAEVELGSEANVESCTGLSADGNRIYALFLSDGIYLIGALSRNDLQPVFRQPLPEIKDGHSILAKEEYLYVVSTGTDEIFRYDLGPKGVSNPVVIWRASDTTTDTHHVNSITGWDGNLVISAFGPKFGTLWSSAFDGYIHDISRNRSIKGGIYHPHSLAVHRNRLYYFESYRKLLWCLEGPVSGLDAYSRGVCWASEHLVCVGSSVGRRFSRSTGLANPADPGELAGSCGIRLSDIRLGRTVKEINLQWFGPEIYDVIILY
jgi:hypothetical protein